MTKQALGEYIKERRLELGISQKELADQLNVAFQTVSKWENGKCYPDIELFPDLARVLDTNEQKLFDESKRPVTTRNVAKLVAITAEVVIALALVCGVTFAALHNGIGKKAIDSNKAAQKGTESQSEPDIELNENLQRVSHIIPADTIIYDVEKEKEYTIANYNLGGPTYIDTFQLEWKAYAYVDLDADGEDELIVEISYTEDDSYWLVLKDRGDKLYAYRYNYRQLTEVYTNGMIGLSTNSGATVYDEGYYSLTFSDHSSDWNIILRKYVPDNDDYVYIVENKQVTEEEYIEFKKDFCEPNDEVTFSPFK